MLIADGLLHSRIESMYQVIVVLSLIVLLIFPPKILAKQRCKYLLTKLHHVQALQRSGYSPKRGLSLRAKEDKARAKWWQCENSGKKKTRKKKKTTKNSNLSSKIKPVASSKIKAGTPFKTTHTIVVKSKYKGKKKQAWQVFYQQPKQCRWPKNIQTFAFCSEDKQAQAADFEQGYQD